MANSNQATREILWNVHSVADVTVLYLFSFIALFICVSGIFLRFKIYAISLNDFFSIGQWRIRIRSLLLSLIMRQGNNRNQLVTLFHCLIVFGVLMLTIATLAVFIHHNLGFNVFNGRTYLLISFLSDVLGIGLLFGLAFALYRRIVLAPPELHSNWGDVSILVLLALVSIQGFLIEGLRIYTVNDPWAAYSPVGWLISKLFTGASVETSRILHHSLWWFHTFSALLLIAIVPYTKLFHIVSGSLSSFLVTSNRPKGALSYPGDIENIVEECCDSEEELRFGIISGKDFEWRDRIGLDGCTSCGRCQSSCPAYAAETKLSPKWLVLAGRDHLLKLHVGLETTVAFKPVAKPFGKLSSAVGRFMLKTFSLPYNQCTSSKHSRGVIGLGSSVEDKLVGHVLDDEVFWACTNCRACVDSCPVCIDHVDLISKVRRGLVLSEGKIPASAGAALRAIEATGNPFGCTESRTEWTRGIQVPILKEGAKVDVVYWVGCMSSYDRRSWKIARSVAEVLNQAGVSWGILGDREHCTGDFARRLGEEAIFQRCAKRNIGVLRSVSFDTLLTSCPHCFNTLKNEYQQIGEISSTPNFKVLHHSEYLSELLESGILKVDPKERGTTQYTYHDPCFLGRYNDLYREPRQVLDMASDGQLTEMSKNTSNAFCCGAGGGCFWFEAKGKEKIPVLRVRQAVETGASMISTACPFCLNMLEDATKHLGLEEQMVVRDIAEVAYASLRTKGGTS